MSRASLCSCLLVALGTLCSTARPAFGQPISRDDRAIRINLHDIVGTINYDGESRDLFRNADDTGSPIKAVYEPAFFPAFNPSKSGPGKLCLTVNLDTPEYRAAASRAASAISPTLVPLVRMPITNAVFTLGPSSPTEPPYPWVVPKSIQGGVSDAFDIVFDVSAQSLDMVRDLAKSSSLRVAYGVLSEDASTASCNISMEIVNHAIFSNKLNGPVDAGRPGDRVVSVTRNQLADAITRGWITLRQECQHGPGQTAQAQLARDAAARLLPILVSQLAIQQKPYKQAIGELANFSFNGADAGVEVDHYFNHLSSLISGARGDSTHVYGSASASVFGLFGGSASADVDVHHVVQSLNTNDATFDWDGRELAPATLNVITLRSADGAINFNLSVSDTMITGTSTETRTFTIPLDRQGTVAGEYASIPVGAVVPFWLSSDEIQKLAPTWLPADGSPVNDTYSPMLGRELPRLNEDRVVVGAPAGTDVVPNNAQNVGGTLSYSASVTVAGTTAKASLVDEIGRVHEGREPRLVIDTAVDELKSADHQHSLSASGSFSKDLPRQPFRRLVYMVRVRF